tara:strand:- start:291 stop:470 length:180 start_codon:yes stop_codon:yes gene_type:complete
MTGSADLSRLRQAEIEALRKRNKELEESNKRLLKAIKEFIEEYKKVEEIKKNKQLKNNL